MGRPKAEARHIIGGMLILVLLALFLVGCGSSSTPSPTAPTPAPVVNTPQPTQPAPARAVLEHSKGDYIEFLSCINGLCRYEATAHNVGTGCANTISGTTRILSAHGVEVGISAWALPAITLVTPGAEFSFSGVDMSQAVLNHLDGTLRTEFQWVDVSCS